MWRFECFTSSCLFTSLDTHRFFSRWVTVFVLAFSTLFVSYVVRRMRNGTMRDVPRSASSIRKRFRFHVPRDVALRLLCGDLSDSPGHVWSLILLVTACFTVAGRPRIRLHHPSFLLTSQTSAAWSAVLGITTIQDGGRRSVLFRTNRLAETCTGGMWSRQ